MLDMKLPSAIPFNQNLVCQTDKGLIHFQRHHANSGGLQQYVQILSKCCKFAAGAKQGSSQSLDRTLLFGYGGDQTTQSADRPAAGGS